MRNSFLRRNAGFHSPIVIQLKCLMIVGFLCVLVAVSVFGDEKAEKRSALEPQRPRGYSIPVIDLAGERHRQVIVDKEPDQYLGHPTTVLLADGLVAI